MSDFIAIATVRTRDSGYVLRREEKSFSDTMTIAEAQETFKTWGHALVDLYAPHSMDIRIQIWGQDMYWSY